MYFISFSESISKDVELMLFDNNFRRITNNFYINASAKSMSDTYNFLSENYLSNFIYIYKDNINISVFFNKMNQK
ncbi:hypothetical protein ACXGXY_001920 [Campylobacter coli]